MHTHTCVSVYEDSQAAFPGFFMKGDGLVDSEAGGWEEPFVGSETVYKCLCNI